MDMKYFRTTTISRVMHEQWSKKERDAGGRTVNGDRDGKGK